MVEQVSEEPKTFEGLPAIAEALRTSVDTVKRRIRDGKLPELKKETVNNRETWVLASADIGTVTLREGWSTIDLRTGHAPPDAQIAEDLVQRYIEAKDGELKATERATSAREAEVRAKAELGESRESLKRETARVRQVTGDLERSNAELGQLETRFNELTVTAQIAEALALERMTVVENQQTELTQTRQAMADTKEDARQKLERAEASLGWFARRRYQKTKAS